MFDFLKKVPLFSELTDEDLRILCASIEEVQLPAGEQLFAEGDHGDYAFLIKEGEIEIIKNASGREVLLAVRRPGEVIGEMALLEQAPRMASVRARKDCQLYAISRDQFEHLLDTSLSAANAVFRSILARWRNTQTMLRQSEKMAELGTLTAGVAHELNNPAAAVERGVAQMQESINGFTQARMLLDSLNCSAEQIEILNELEQLTLQKAEQPALLDALARSDLEAALEEWLDQHDIPNAWELAPALASLDFDRRKLDELAQRFSAADFSVVVEWLHTSYSIYNLLAEIRQGASRIAGIVKALKSYTYLDQAPVQNVNINEGLDDTLMILRNKLKAGVDVHREYDPQLPRIVGFGSELNQVWTNLIDNAIDAMQGHGVLTLRTRQDGKWVLVDIEDNGPGIPPEVMRRLFEPFFTTKPLGKGTGLGLQISYNIVVLKHRGDIKVFSEPGKTLFQVWLPLNFQEQ